MASANYPFFFIAPHPTNHVLDIILHQCSVPQEMPLHHAVAFAWEDFDTKVPLLSDRIKKGLLSVRLTTDFNPFENGEDPYETRI